MQLIGERINGMFLDVKQAIADQDKKVIQDLAIKQTEAGAAYLDVNVGTAAADQEGTIQWLVESIQEVCQTPLCLDSQKPNVIAAGLKVLNADNGGMLNSTPLNKKNDEDIKSKTDISPMCILIKKDYAIDIISFFFCCHRFPYLFLLTLIHIYWPVVHSG